MRNVNPMNYEFPLLIITRTQDAKLPTAHPLPQGTASPSIRPVRFTESLPTHLLPSQASTAPRSGARPGLRLQTLRDAPLPRHPPPCAQPPPADLIHPTADPPTPLPRATVSARAGVADAVPVRRRPNAIRTRQPPAPRWLHPRHAILPGPVGAEAPEDHEEFPTPNLIL